MTLKPHLQKRMVTSPRDPLVPAMGQVWFYGHQSTGFSLIMAGVKNYKQHVSTFKILQWERLAIALLGNTLTHHKAFIVHSQCPFPLKRGKLCPYSITCPHSINSSLGNWHLGVPPAECILALRAETLEECIFRCKRISEE